MNEFLKNIVLKLKLTDHRNEQFVFRNILLLTIIYVKKVVIYNNI